MQRLRLKTASLATLILLAGLVAIGCSEAKKPEATPEPAHLTHYVGVVDGTDAFVAIVVDGRRAQGFVTDGMTMAYWFTSVIGIDGADYLDGDNSPPTAFSAGSRMLVQISPTEVKGQFRPLNSTPHDFKATPVSSESAGLYRSEETINGEAWVGGWVVMADGQLHGALMRNRSIEGQTALRPAAKRMSAFVVPVINKN